VDSGLADGGDMAYSGNMPYGFMNVRELAGLLGIDERRAEKLALRDHIPCQKVAGQLRFNRAEITDWLQRQMAELNRERLDSVDAGITAHRQVPAEDMIITPLLRVEAVSLALPARTKNSVLRELVQLAEQTELLYDAEALLEALLAREELCSTALPGGIAIPHPRRPLPYSLGDSILVVARTSQGIGYGAPDGRLTDLFFMTCSLDDRHHLHILARLCRLLHDGTLAEELCHAETEDAMVELIKTHESKLAAP